jgi:hypothetical protein
MEIFAALLAKIFLGRALSAKNADTGAMLPDFTNVALNEEAGNVFSKFYGIEEIQVGTFHGWATRVFFCITDTTNGFVLLFLEVIAAIRHFKSIGFRSLLVLVFVVALSPSTEEGIVKIFKWLRGQRGTGGGLVGRGFGD